MKFGFCFKILYNIAPLSDFHFSLFYENLTSLNRNSMVHFLYICSKSVQRLEATDCGISFLVSLVKLSCCIIDYCTSIVPTLISWYNIVINGNPNLILHKLTFVHTRLAAQAADLKKASQCAIFYRAWQLLCMDIH